MSTPYQPKTGRPCHCRPGIARDNCPACEGTGMQIDFAAIRARPLTPSKSIRYAYPSSPEGGKSGRWYTLPDNKTHADFAAAFKHAESLPGEYDTASHRKDPHATP